jgi:DNA modification methylase
MPSNSIAKTKSSHTRAIKNPDDLRIEHLPLSSIKPCAGNARRHDKKQVEQISESLKKFNFINPIIVDENSEIIAGHGRYEAAKLAGLTTVPVIRVSHLTPAEVRAYRLLDNKLAENSKWDEKQLAIELSSLMEAELKCEIDFSLEITGFSSAEIDRHTEKKPIDEPEDSLELLPQRDKPAISNAGDVWLLGNHVVICGDSLNPATYEKLRGASSALSREVALLCTDPPYNVVIDGHVSGLGKIKHAEFAMAAGEMSETEFASFLQGFLQHATNCLADGSCSYIFMDWRHDRELQAAARQVGLTQLNLAIWDKGVGGMGGFYRSQHELVFIYRKGSTQHRNNIQLGKFGRNRTNVWSYPSANMSRQGRAALKDHPTPKPVAMIADIMKDVTVVGDAVLDCFLGGGSTLIAAEKTHRRCLGIELDPYYVDACIRRWQLHTGQSAVHASHGTKFDDLENGAKPLVKVRTRERTRHV